MESDVHAGVQIDFGRPERPTQFGAVFDEPAGELRVLGVFFPALPIQVEPAPGLLRPAGRPVNRLLADQLVNQRSNDVQRDVGPNLGGKLDADRPFHRADEVLDVQSAVEL